MKKIFIFLILSSTWFPPTFSYIASIALWKKDDKQVAVLGDVHQEVKADICHRSSFMPFLDRLSKSTQKTELVLEHLQESVVPEIEPACINAISEYAYKIGLTKGSFKFIMADIRQEFDISEKIRNVSLILFGNIGERFSNCKSAQQNPLSNTYLLESIDSVIKIIDSLKIRVKNSEAKTFFELTKQDLLKLKNKLEILFNKYNQEVQLKIGQSKCILPAGSFAATIAKAASENESREQLYEDYIKPILGDLADVFFINAIIESQNRVANTLYYGGLNHTKAINRLLLSLGYELIYHIGDHEVLFILPKADRDYTPVNDKDLDYLFRMFTKNMKK